MFGYRIVRAFENIVNTLISQNNFTEYFIVDEDVALIAKQVKNAQGSQLCIYYPPLDFVLFRLQGMSLMD